MTGLPTLRMLDSAATARIWLATEPQDMRCGFDRLAERARTVTAQDPLGGHLFVFRSRRGDRLKILMFDHDGWVLWYKRLEAGGSVQTAAAGRGAGGRVARQRVAMVLDGIDPASVRRMPATRGKRSRRE